MHSYKKEKPFPKRKLIVSLLCLLAVSVSYLSYEYYEQTKPKDTAVFKEQDTPVLVLPSATTQTFMKPFTVEANVALDYFNGVESDVDNVTEFEGVYRGNQGMDYTFNEEVFDVFASVDATVSDVKEDAIFGTSVTLVNGDLTITYQSLSEVAVQKGDTVKQMDVIAKAGKNIYNKDLGNHLHIVVEKNGRIIDPKTAFDKALSDIK